MLHDLALGDHARALINGEGQAARAVRDRDGEGIRPDHRSISADRRDGCGRIGEADADQALASQLVRVVAEKPAIVGVADRECRNSRLAGKGHEGAEPIGDRWMGKARPRIGDEQRRSNTLGRRIRPAIDLSDPKVLAIDRDIGEPVRGDSGDLRCGGCGRDRLRTFGRRPMCHKGTHSASANLLGRQADMTV
jgi:hypothetical protein